MLLASGTRLGSYEILTPLGTVPGEAYKAADTGGNRTVILKMLPPQFSELPEMTERLKREIQTIASLKHPHISAPLDVAEAAANHDSTAAAWFLVTEHLEGESLADRRTRGPLGSDQALKI